MKQNEGTVGGRRRIPSGRKAGLRQAGPDILPAIIPAQLDAGVVTIVHLLWP
jgi:hypothetical protein